MFWALDCVIKPEMGMPSTHPHVPPMTGSWFSPSLLVSDGVEDVIISHLEEVHE